MSTTITLKSLLESNGLNEHDLDLEIDRIHYQKISHYLTKWRVLGLVDDGDVVAIETDRPQEEDRKVEFLVHLKQKFSFKVTYGLLVRSLLENERADDARSLCAHLKSKFCLDLCHMLITCRVLQITVASAQTNFLDHYC